MRDLSIGEEEEEQRSQGPQSQPATSGQSRIIERDLKNFLTVCSGVLQCPIQILPLHIRGLHGYKRDPELRWQAPLAHIQYEGWSRGAPW